MPNTRSATSACWKSSIDQLGVSRRLVLFDADYIKYYTGFAFIPTERPMAYAVKPRPANARSSCRGLNSSTPNPCRSSTASPTIPEYPDLNHPHVCAC